MNIESRHMPIFIWLFTVALIMGGCGDWNGEGDYREGERFFVGDGVKIDYKKALALFEKASAKGNAKADARLGLIYHYGYGIEKDHERAGEFYMKAARKGEPMGYAGLGVIYSQGDGVERDYEQAVNWLNKGIEKGDHRAQWVLGGMFYRGEGVEKDTKRALALYRESIPVTKNIAKGGHPFFIGNLAKMYINIGWMYEKGWGVKRDFKQAVAWYRKAAELGNARAQNNLGAMYGNALGVPEDIEAAYDLYRIAEAAGNEEARSNLGRSTYRNIGDTTPARLRRGLRQAWLAAVPVVPELPAPPQDRPFLAKASEILGVGDAESALELLDMSVANEGESGLSQLYRGAALLALGQNEEGKTALQRAIKLDAGLAPQIYPWLTRVFLATGDRQFSVLEKWRPMTAEGLLLRGMVQLQQKQPGSALETLKQALEKNPGKQVSAAIQSALAEVHFHSAFAVKPALAALDKAVADDPEQGYYLLQRAWLRYLRGKIDEAATDAGQAIEKMPDSPLPYLFRARALRAAGKTDMAAADERKAEQMPADDTMLRATLVLNKKAFVTGEAIELDYAVSPELVGNAWVGVIPSKTPHGLTSTNDDHDVDYTYLNKISGRLRMTAPLVEGQWDLRVSDPESGIEVDSVSFEVSLASGRLFLSERDYAPGQSIKLRVDTSVPLTEEAWVGLFKKSAPHGKSGASDPYDLDYSFLDGKARTELDFTAPEEPGAYQFRLFDSSAADGNELAVVDFSVGQ